MDDVDDNIYIYLYNRGLACTEEFWSVRRSLHRNWHTFNKQVNDAKRWKITEENSDSTKIVIRRGARPEIASVFPATVCNFNRNKKIIRINIFDETNIEIIKEGYRCYVRLSNVVQLRSSGSHSFLWATLDSIYV